MSAAPAALRTPRIVLYHQTHVHPQTRAPISLLPLLTSATLPPNLNLTIIVAALHLNEDPNHITLNDHPPSHPHHAHLWPELPLLKAAGITIMGMLGGACPGTFSRLDSQAGFDTHYPPLRDLLRQLDVFDGLDLDVEEPMSQAGITRLIDALRADFGAAFIITLAPVATALRRGGGNLSGFSYHALEAQRGGEIAWYNTQFYCGWGELPHYEGIVREGWKPEKVVAGVVTNPVNAGGFVPLEGCVGGLMELGMRCGPGFGGVMGWEYWNCMPGGEERPWEWIEWMGGVLGAC
ncbi:glycoside hydrolase superfamily [Geopyxis carbonaria]|nr:glycoside hydrolase superfamily [Geopyxis carbonaria]